MSIRLQLLIVALTTLVLPWAGCQYARELETALRDSQEKSLLASAGTIANALSAAAAARISRSDDTQAFAPDQGDLYVYPLHNQPLLDGYRDDWGVAADPEPLPSADGYRRTAAGGFHRALLFLYRRGRRPPLRRRAAPTCIPNMTASIASISRCSGPTARWSPISLPPARPA